MTDTNTPAEAVKKPRRAPTKAAATLPAEPKSLLELIGGDEAIVTTIAKLTDKLFADPRINYVLFGVSRSDMEDHNKAFLSVLLKEDSEASTTDLGKAFAALLEKGLKRSHITLMFDHLRDSLKEKELSDDLSQALATGANEIHQQLFGK